MKSALSKRFLIAFCLTGVSVCGCDYKDDSGRRRVGVDAFVDVSTDEHLVCGQLFVGVFDRHRSLDIFTSENALYQSTFRRNSAYEGMEDNDIRGYLDGSFKEGWNQVSQTHLRLGRRGRNPAFGEFELFRNLHRWADLPMPPNVEIDNAKLLLTLESGPPFSVDVAVYAVNKDWNPGRGGTNQDNNSPPDDGEAWWLDAKRGEIPWARAGAGYASDSDGRADTGAQPLAIAHYIPGETEQLSFGGDRLAEYIEERIHQGEPLLFLYKLVDVYEDSVGSVLEIWSANHGTDGSSRRPAMRIDWKPAGADLNKTYALALEPGRAVILPDIKVGESRYLASSFLSAPALVGDTGKSNCQQRPFVQYRPSASNGAWTALPHPLLLSEPNVDLRVSATKSPHSLGSDFTAEITDTWVPAGAPEEQIVTWEFQGPGGHRQDIVAEYAGDYSWKITLSPTILGRWKYRWRHSLSGHEVSGETRTFDVVAWERKAVLQGLTSLQNRINASGAQPGSHEMLPFEIEFMRMQRTAVALPPGIGNEVAIDSRIVSQLRDIRESLSGKPVPTEFLAEPIRSRAADSQDQR